jgi:predicted transcriptional regulator
MQYQWILDVLDDLRSFAERNGLDDLSRQIDLTMAVAASDIAKASGGTALAFSRTGPLPGGDEVTGTD